jgi:hypothetical protein
MSLAKFRAAHEITAPGFKACLSKSSESLSTRQQHALGQG